MFRLIKFQATNVIGFASGLNRKTFTLDLTEFKNKDVITIVGDNASGKSTFLSLVHPSHTPTDGRNKFIVPGKEGSLIRTYLSDDGTIIVTKCIYSPKSDGGHQAKTYLSIQKPGDKESIELNPNGNVTSYNNLLQTYFGITKEYLSFASYSDAVNNIVRMTDTERKMNVSSLIPNTGRFELAYNTINEKYKEYRNMIRNVSQKILALRDMDSLVSDLQRVKVDLAKARDARDENIRKFAKAEGRVRELSHGEDIDYLLNQYNKMLHDMMQKESDLSNLYARLSKLYRKLDITPFENSVEFKGMDEIPQNISFYERKIATSESVIKSASSRIDEINSSISKIEKEILDAESTLFSLQTEDIDQLKAKRKAYQQQLDELQYTKNKDKFEDMSYDEVTAFAKSLGLLDQMIEALYVEYGQFVSEYFAKNSQIQEVQSLDQLKATIQTKSAKKDMLYRQLIEKEQYRKFQDILDQRPATCHIDSCPFIANALKYQHISGEIAELKEQYNALGIEIEEDEKSVEDFEKRLFLRKDIVPILQMVKSEEKSFRKYLNLSLEDVYIAIARGMWQSVFDMIKIKSITAVLSEKELYKRITGIMIPEVEHAIEMAKLYGTNRDLIASQLDRLHRDLIDLNEERQLRDMDYKISQIQKEKYEKKLRLWRELQELLQEFKDTSMERSAIKDATNSKKSAIDTISDLVDKCKGYDYEIQKNETILTELTPVKQQIEMDISTLTHLHEEKEQIEQDFLVIDVIRSIAQPGKGIRKELINIYMYDIFQTANQLLLNTFDGRLLLKEFIITDKEFVIPYEFNGNAGSDISVASSAQQSTISMVLSLAILAKMVDRYGVLTLDEADQALSVANKSVFVDILMTQAKYIGLNQVFIITHSPEYYLPHDVGFLLFPGASGINKKNIDAIEV